LAAYLYATEREQSYRSSDQGIAARPDLASGNAPERGRLIADERIRLFFQVNSIPGLRYVRYLHVLAVAGATLVGLVSWALAGSALVNVAIYCGLVCLCESLITVVNRSFQNRTPGEAELKYWAWGKTALSACNGGAWSLGPILLHVDDAPISVLAPVWGVVNYIGAAVLAGAFFPPSIVAMMAGATLPAAIWLLSFGTGIELAAGICMGFSLPFMLLIGLLSIRKTGEAIEARLEIADLLRMQTHQTRQIRDLHHDRNRFFSAASHDLRQPLHAMGFYNSLLSRERSETERGELLGRLSECAASLDRQFNAIIGVARTDAAIEAAAIDVVPVQDVIDRAVANLQPEADSRALRLRVVRTGLWASVAPELLERVLSNLLSNAIKYTPAGGVLVGARRCGAHIHLVVADTGIGIAPEDIGLIFRDFFQISNRERNDSRGYGLGLGIVRRLCTGMHWPLNVNSIVGRGTIFSVQVPAAAKGESGASPATHDVAAVARTESDTVSVLFIDDDALVRDAMGRMLADWDFAAALCETGAEAIALLRNDDQFRRWHVLLDFRLAGGTDGLTVADQLRAEFGDRVRVTLMSGETDEELQDGAAQRGILLLRKPVKPIRLRAVLTSP
jgi:two-component system, sensor histidine kinase